MRVRHQVSLSSKAGLLQSLGRCCWSSLTASVACLSWLQCVAIALLRLLRVIDAGAECMRLEWVQEVRCTFTSPQPTTASAAQSQDSYFCKWLSNWPTPKSKLLSTSLHINFLMTDYWVLYCIPLVYFLTNGMLSYLLHIYYSSLYLGIKVLQLFYSSAR